MTLGSGSTASCLYRTFEAVGIRVDRRLDGVPLQHLVDTQQDGHHEDFLLQLEQLIDGLDNGSPGIIGQLPQKA